MQKKLIALAIAGLSSAAFAQTNVTLYGIADVAFESVKASGGTADPTGTITGMLVTGDGYSNFSRVASNSSYIGFKGAEDLGDGLKAVFQFETGFNADTGVWSGAARDTYAGLAGGFGTVVFGNLTGPTRALGGRMEMLPGNTNAGTAVSLLGNAANFFNTGTTGTFDTRLANSVAYISPDFNGFNGVIAYSSGENKSLDNVAAGAQLNTKAYDLGLNYANGPLDLGLTYGKVDTDTDSAAGGVTGAGALTGVKDIKNIRFGAGYNFGVAKVTFQYNKQTINFGSGDDLDHKSYSLQGSYSITPAGKLIADYTVAKELEGSLVTGLNDSGAKLVTVGYLHSLSKRTTLKAVWTRLTNDSNARYNFSSSAIGATGVGGFGYGADPQALSMGLRHSF
ncbi:MAG: porin [Rhodocyclaceae bacterium]|jgi:predicted porin|nr:porin [Rhodocyclaceae bacterium]